MTLANFRSLGASRVAVSFQKMTNLHLPQCPTLQIFLSPLSEWTDEDKSCLDLPCT